MGLDLLVYYMIGPIGLVTVAVGLALPLVLWGVLLRGAYHRFGPQPFFAGYAGAAIGLLVTSVATSILMYVERKSEFPDLPPITDIVPGWSITLFVVMATLALVPLGLVCVPVAALLARFGWLRPWVVALAVLLLVVGLTTWIWMSPPNQWRGLNREAAFWITLAEYGAWIVMGACGFFAGVMLQLHRQRLNPIALPGIPPS